MNIDGRLSDHDWFFPRADARRWDSEINIWRQVAASDLEYALVLEVDVWFRSGFARQMDLAWGELGTEGKANMKK